MRRNARERPARIDIVLNNLPVLGMCGGLEMIWKERLRSGDVQALPLRFVRLSILPVVRTFAPL
jgi:hypothetical protein